MAAATTNVELWDPSRPELLPRLEDWHHAHPQSRADLEPRRREHVVLKRIAQILFAPIVFVWVVAMGVFLIPVFIPLAVLFLLPIGAHYPYAESPDPERQPEAPSTRPDQGA